MPRDVISPARKARTGHIWLEPTNGGVGTPPFEDGTRIAIRGDHLVYGRESISITTLRAAAKFVGVELSPDPGVGRDLPPYAPDADLAVDARVWGVLGSWYTFANDVLDVWVPKTRRGMLSRRFARRDRIKCGAGRPSRAPWNAANSS